MEHMNYIQRKIVNAMSLICVICGLFIYRIESSFGILMVSGGLSVMSAISIMYPGKRRR